MVKLNNYKIHQKLSSKVLLFSVLFLSLIISSFTVTNAEDKIRGISANILMHGKVTNAKSKEPIKSGNINFLDASGKKVNTATILNDGTYSGLVFAKEGNYTPILKGYVATSECKTLVVPKIESSREEVIHFNFMPLEIGMPIAECKAFKNNDTTLTSSTISELDNAIEFLKQNNTVVANVYVNAGDTKFKAIKTTISTVDKFGKPKKQAMTISPEMQMKSFIAARINAIRNYIESKTQRKSYFIYLEGKASAPAKASKDKSKKGAVAVSADVKLEIAKIKNIE